MNKNISMDKFILTVVTCLFMVGCHIEKNQKDSSNDSKLPKRPNILWLVTEDMGAYIPSFGDSTIVTPHLSRLAAEGVCFPNLYSPSGVCAPSRAAIATGMYPSSIGANHMRVNSYTKERGLPAYEAVPPAEVKMISELLRSQGYYCSNNYKEDYQFKAPVTAWDESSSYAHWRNRNNEQPFFSVFNFTVTHESGLFEPYGFREIETRYDHLGDRTYQWKNKGTSPANNKSKEAETPILVSKDTEFKIPPYLPNTPVVQRDMWKLYNNIAEMDRQVGMVLKQLEEDGLLENTLIFFYGDHGGPLPREKRLIYDSGLKTPLIIRFPNKLKAGTIDEQLLSFVDFAPTLLSVIGQHPKNYMQGKAFLGANKAEVERTYIHGAADRFDAETDIIRAVKDGQFKYIRNYLPELPYYLPITYRERIPSMQELIKLREAGRLNDIQKQWFRASKPQEELFDCIADPNELVNLAGKAAYSEKLHELRAEMDRWLSEINDNPSRKEKDLISFLWNGSSKKPITAPPKVSNENGVISIACKTEGASIGYKIEQPGTAPQKSWLVYTKPFSIADGSKLVVKAHRIGYVSSKTLELVFEKE